MKYFATKISENLHKTPEGYLLAIGVRIARVGVMEYGRGETPLEPGSDGIVRISRDEDEVFRKETIASFEGKPVTIGHPNDFVNTENWKDLAKGLIQNVRRGSGETADDLICDILITDAFAISLVENGLRQLSCGYEAEYIQTEPGAGIQKNIVGNHLALVQEGRAGDAYAINDHKGVFRMNKKLADMLKSLFGKTVDQALAEEEKKEADAKAAAEAKKVEKKTLKKKAGDKKSEAADMKGMDELVAMCKDLMDKVQKMGQPQDEEMPEEEASDEESPAEKSMEDRMKALEMAVSKLLEREAKEDEVPVGDEEEEEEVVIDEEKEEKAEDEESEEAEDAEGDYKLTGDEKARVEILAPGLEAGKNFKVDALKAAYKTEDGKKAIDLVTGGQPKFDKEGQVDMMFIAASELLKAQRGQQMSRTKKVTDFSSAIFEGEGAMTAEKMNELNAKHYNQKK